MTEQEIYDQQEREMIEGITFRAVSLHTAGIKAIEIAKAFNSLQPSAEEAANNLSSFFEGIQKLREMVMPLYKSNNWLKMHGYPKRRKV